MTVIFATLVLPIPSCVQLWIACDSDCGIIVGVIFGIFGFIILVRCWCKHCGQSYNEADEESQESHSEFAHNAQGASAGETQRATWFAVHAEGQSCDWVGYYHGDSDNTRRANRGLTSDIICAVLLSAFCFAVLYDHHSIIVFARAVCVRRSQALHHSQLQTDPANLRTRSDFRFASLFLFRRFVSAGCCHCRVALRSVLSVSRL